MGTLGLDFDSQKYWLLPALGFIVFSLVAILLDRILWRKLDVMARSTKTKWDDHLLPRVRRPVQSLFAIGVVSATLALAPASLSSDSTLHTVIHVILITCIIWLIDRIVIGVIEGAGGTAQAQSARTLARFGLRVLFFILGSLVVLDNLGISITPILASLGVSSLAVALALQDTLSNFFSGIYLLMERPIEPGQLIELEGGSTGTVRKVGWRNTELLTGQNNVVLVPNATVAKSRITNFDLDESRTNAGVEFTLAYGTDLDRVKVVLAQTVRELTHAEARICKDFEPVIRCVDFKERGIGMLVEVSVFRHKDRGIVRDQLIAGINDAFQKAGIEFPKPTVL